MILRLASTQPRCLAGTHAIRRTLYGHHYCYRWHDNFAGVWTMTSFKELVNDYHKSWEYNDLRDETKVDYDTDRQVLSQRWKNFPTRCQKIDDQNVQTAYDNGVSVASILRTRRWPSHGSCTTTACVWRWSTATLSILCVVVRPRVVPPCGKRIIIQLLDFA